MQSFEHGALCGGVRLGGPFEIHGAIYVKWIEFGGPSFAWPKTDESAGPAVVVGTTISRGRPRSTGRLTLERTSCTDRSWASGSSSVMPAAQLGYPTTDEIDNVDNASTGRRDRCHRFQGGYISWNIDSGAHVHINVTVSTLTVAHLKIHSIRSAHQRHKRDQPLCPVPGQPVGVATSTSTRASNSWPTTRQLLGSTRHQRVEGLRLGKTRQAPPLPALVRKPGAPRDSTWLASPRFSAGAQRGPVS